MKCDNRKLVLALTSPRNSGGTRPDHRGINALQSNAYKTGENSTALN